MTSLKSISATAMNDRPIILTVKIADDGSATATLDDGQLTGGRQETKYGIDKNIVQQLVKRQFEAIRGADIEEARRMGQFLTQHLLPQEIRTLFPKDGEALLLSTNKHNIPWEFLWEGDFLGVRFAMGRQLITGDRIRKPGSPDKKRKKTCLFLTNPTEDLPESQKEAQQLMRYFRSHGIACTLLAGEQVTSADILIHLGSKFDIVHYSGHIDIDAKGACLRLSGKDRFYLKETLALDDFGHPFVFLNGCGGGPAWGSSTRIVKPLIYAGCGPILCATMPITDKGSRVFSEQIITNVLQGMPYGKATMEARKRFCSDLSGGTDWMCFAYYGNPLERAVSFESEIDDNPVIANQISADPIRDEEGQGLKHTQEPPVAKSGTGNAPRRRKILQASIICIALFIVSAISLMLYLNNSATSTETTSRVDIADNADTSVASALPSPLSQPEPAAAAEPVIPPAAVTAPAKAVATPTAIPVAPKPTPVAAAATAEDFYGRWENSTGIILEIAQNELARSLDGVNFRMNIIQRETITNTDTASRVNYPTGVRFVGTVTSKGWWLDSPEVGATHTYTFYLGTDRKSVSQNGSTASGNVYRTVGARRAVP
jgi:hypothetical protein